MIDPRDKATEPEGFQEWMKSFEQDNDETFYKLEVAAKYPTRKRPLSEEKVEAVKYYIFRACWDAKNMDFEQTIQGRKKDYKKTPLSRRTLYPVRVGNLVFSKPYKKKLRPFDDPVQDFLIYTLAAIIKSALARKPFSPYSSRIDIRVGGGKVSVLEIPPGIRFNKLNEIIADLVVSALKIQLDMDDPEVKEQWHTHVAHRLDALKKKKNIHLSLLAFPSSDASKEI
jgi:hypothetical protein